MTASSRASAILEALSREITTPASELTFRNEWELIVAVVLSAQCTDKRVNMVTPALFDAYPSPEAMAGAAIDDIFEYVKSVSYPRNKATHLKGLAEKLVSDFGGKVPSEIDELRTLPGVGQKTANVVAAVAFSAPVIAVDTHVFRVAHRLGLSEGTTPAAVEKDLTALIPESMRPDAHHYLLLFGRYRCKAIKPMCENCPVEAFCCKD